MDDVAEGLDFAANGNKRKRNLGLFQEGSDAHIKGEEKMEKSSADTMTRLEALEKEVARMKGETHNAPRPRGCICPAGAEKTCKGWDCPRRVFDMRVT